MRLPFADSHSIFYLFTTSNDCNLCVSDMFRVRWECFFTLFSNAQVVSDTIKSVDLSEVVVTGSYRHAQEKKTTLTLELFQKDYLNRHFTGNLVQTLKMFPVYTRWILVRDSPNL